VNKGKWAWIGISLLLHGGLSLIALTLEQKAPPAPEKKDPLAQVRIQNDKVELPKPPPPKIEKKEPPKAEPPKPEPKKAEAPKKTPPKKQKLKKKPKKKRRAVVKKKKVANKTPPQVVPSTAPAPLVLSNVSLGGGIAVVQGDDDIFGDPESSRKGIKTAPSVKPEPVGVENPKPPKKLKKVLPKPFSSNPRQVPWPSDLPNRNEQFRVKLSLLVNTKGRVAKVTIVSGVGEPFDSAARKFAKKLRFTPATGERGQPIPYPVPWELCWNCNQ